jgi:hypothetical protein
MIRLTYLVYDHRRFVLVSSHGGTGFYFIFWLQISAVITARELPI